MIGLKAAQKSITMSGVWIFDSDGVFRLDKEPLVEVSSPGPAMGHKVLVYKATNASMSSYDQLNENLLKLGWKPYYQNDWIRQYHRGDHNPDLITLPSFFCDLRTTHMYDIVVKTRSAFEVRNAT